MKIGFIAISHTDYTGSLVDEVASLALSGLLKRGIKVYVPPEKQAQDDVQAMAAGRSCVHNDVDAVILFFSTWAECPVIMSALREVEHLPVLIWGFPMVETAAGKMSTGSYVTYAMFKGVLDRIGFPYRGLLGPVDDPQLLNEIHSFCTAAAAYQRLKRSRVGLMGYTSMGIYTGTFDHVLLRTRIGPEVHHLDAYSYFNRVRDISDGEAEEAVRLLKSSTGVASDVTNENLDTIGRMYQALQSLRRQHRLDAINIKCQYEFSKEFGMVACVPLALAADHGIVSSCEGDILNTVSMMMLHLLTGDVASYGDAINHEGNVLTLSSCGFSPFSLAAEESASIRAFMPNRGFSGVQTSFVLRPGRITVLRLIEDVGDYHLLYFTGEGLAETTLREGYFPALQVRLDGSVDELVRQYSGQHFALCYGDHAREVEDLARILRIKAVRV